MSLRAVLAIALVVGLLALGGCTTKVITSGGATPLNTVTASGAGEQSAPPDEAEMSFGAVARSENADDALREATETAKGIIAAVMKAGVDDKDVQTQNLSVYPEYREPADSKTLEITGYTANASVRVTIRNVDDVGGVISAAVDAGANDIGGPSFTISDDSDARDAAIQKAMDDARRRAETMAKAAGKNLGAIISVSETGVNVPVYYAAERTADAGGVAIEPGTLDVTANVAVVFELK